MFEIKNLSVGIGERQIIKDLSLSLKAGEIHAVMGPNGAGKSTLASALMGHPLMQTSGEILLNGESMVKLQADERARKGMFLAFQNPQEIEGVNIANLLRKAKLGEEKDKKKILEEMMGIQKDIESAASKVGMQKEFLKRDLNVGFSGGEKKRNEMLQMLALNPKVIIIDEIDSGLDIDALKMVANALEGMRSPERCILLITHYERILEYVKPDFVHILVDGKIAKSGGMGLARELVEKGYEKILVE
jgi:Fe-S cluster assembly ATP-binding protein